WMSSNKGVFRARKQDLNDVADGKKSSLTCVSYGEADGMGSRECNGGYNPSGWKLRDGKLAFSTVRGLAVVDPANIKLNTVPPPVIMERFLVDGQAQPLGASITVAPGRQRFEFQYTGISFAGAAEVHFKYMLEGLDKDWIDAGTHREAFYTHLDPGMYRFHVIAANSDGIWNEAGAAVDFKLRPYFYQSAWFIGLIIFLFLTTGPTYYFLRMRAVNKRKAELEQQVGERTVELQKTVQNLKETQHQLILSEKMASLGQLTAGIAHEIKNPLNFITNFAVLSHDLVRDLRTELVAERGRVEPARAKEIGELLDDLEQNVGKINDHGRRADSIVRGMLLHSRGKPGERQETDLNALLAEYTSLAYHGMRAQDQSFNVKIETDFDPSVGKVRVVPQDLSRAFLNIVNNACYAAYDKRKAAGDSFTPTVRVSTRAVGGCIEIRIRDNGNGIPQVIRDKIFNPFFTTKPPGVGTGLGLSLTYDIITGEHKGQIAVDSREGEYTEFVITLLRNSVEEGGKAA
ncbi:MAG TPA: ATP-binding protein, partial [Bacteroidota bacterium]